MPFLAKQSLPHRIPPVAYRDAAICAAEMAWMKQNTWQFVCSTDELDAHGKYVTLKLLGTPVAVRNFDGEIVAISNVCSHRHSLIRSEPQGCTPDFSCQYHGWCFGKDGLTRRIPCAKDLAPIDREKTKLPTYRVATVGRLVFVSLGSAPMPIADYLGPMYDIYTHRCSDDWPLTLKLNTEYEANWKVAVENTLEAYHVQCVHPNTFRTDPGEERSTHEFDEIHSSFRTDMPFAAESRLDKFFQQSQGRLIKWLGGSVHGQYEHHHRYPNLLTSFTDAITLVQSVVPISPTRSDSIIRQFGYRPANLTYYKRWTAQTWQRFESGIANKILQEDFEMLPIIQSGLNHSNHEGILARSEERIAAFQRFWCDRMYVCEHAGDSI